MVIRLLIGLWLFSFHFFIATTQGATQPYLQELIEQAVRDKLYAERSWHLILHYRKNFFSGHTSEVDDPGFFLADNGKTDPEAELRATLTFFFSDALVGRSQQPAQCAFVARYHWLNEKLKFDETKLPPRTCERFHQWFDEFDAEFISMIFPSAYMGNPASMFGHTFLRVDPKDQTEQTRILAYTINYAAEVPPDAGIEYAYKGIFGGYKGFFSTIPYYLKVKEYRDIENRDIWEYRLNFSPKQIDRLLMHAWELGNAYFDYFFFKENCAYHILSLLEVADPSLHLTERFHFWTIPADTIRLLVQNQGLVGEVSYRPARSTQLKRKRETLNQEERQWIAQLVEDPSVSQHEEFLAFSTEEQASLLDVASDFLRYQSLTDPDQSEKYKTSNRAVLVERSKRRIPSSPLQVIPPTSSPEHGHESFRVGTGGGWRNHEMFEEISFRAGYHDLLDPDPGYTLDAQIVLGDLGLRHYHSRNKFRVERFTLANVISLAPIDSWFQSPSWKVKVGMDTVKTRSCDLCSNGHFNGGVGGAVETHILQREVFFLFGEFDANVSGAYDENYRVGGGVSSGLMANVTDNWKWLISGGYLGYPLGDHSDDAHISVGQRFTLAKNFALRTTFTHHDRDNEILAVFQGYF